MAVSHKQTNKRISTPAKRPYARHLVDRRIQSYSVKADVHVERGNQVLVCAATTIDVCLTILQL